jgi:hypothetical protein
MHSENEKHIMSGKNQVSEPLKRSRHRWNDNTKNGPRKVIRYIIFECHVLYSNNTLYVHSQQNYIPVTTVIIIILVCVYFVCSSVFAYFKN